VKGIDEILLGSTLTEARNAELNSNSAASSDLE